MPNKPKCGCGNTQNPDGFCDGSHNKQINNDCHYFKLSESFQSNYSISFSLSTMKPYVQFSKQALVFNYI